MKAKWLSLICVSCLLLVIVCSAFGQVPRTISYQGRLTNDVGTPLDGTYTLTFRLYDAETGGTSIWSEARSVTVSNGLFSVALGSLNQFNPNVKFDRQYFLGIDIDGTAVMPRQPFRSAPYALGMPGITSELGGPTTIDVSGMKYIFRPGYLTLAMHPGSDHYPYISWLDSDGSRGAYLGWGTKNSSFLLNMKEGVEFHVNGLMDVNALGTQYLFRPGVLTLAPAAGSTHYPFIDWHDTEGNRDAYLGYGTMNESLELEMKNGLQFHINGPTIINNDTQYSFGTAALSLTKGTASTHYPYINWYDSDGSRGAYLGYGTKNSSFGLYLKSGVTFDVNGPMDVSGRVDVGGDCAITGNIFSTGTDLVLRGRGGGAGNNSNSGRALVDGGPADGLVLNYANDFGKVGIWSNCEVRGGITCNALTLTSSSRFKEDVKPIDDPLHTINKLQGVSYNWDEEHGGKRDMGFIAEDVAKVLPELVTMEPDGKNAVGMDYTHLIALAIEGIKAQQKEIEALQAENAALLAAVQALQEGSAK